jgi:riboflavin synthase
MVIEAADMDMTDLKTGASICVNGACLTLTEINGTRFNVDISRETLACTTLGSHAVGERVNLEKAMQAGDRLDGHIVTGHIDGTGTVLSIQDDARSRRYGIEIPASLRRYVCRKGSICVDGVSLTVNELSDTGMEVNIIPHTMQRTIIPDYRAGTRVNLEVDIIARYIERLAISS